MLHFGIFAFLGVFTMYKLYKKDNIMKVDIFGAISNLFFSSDNKPKADNSYFGNTDNGIIHASVNLNNIPQAHYVMSDIQSGKKYPNHKESNYRACLLGGAIGDALGAPVEFMRLSEIRNMYGRDGIVDLETPNGKAYITDDTQMTIFTADGLIKSSLHSSFSDKKDEMEQVYGSYQNWLNTQRHSGFKVGGNGWITGISALYARRAPGLTCTGSLKNNIPGSIENPVNSSKGCGGVMRVAPAGLKYYKDSKKAFDVGARCAALTHGSPDAYLPAGIHSCIIANLIQGKSLDESVDIAMEILKEYDDHENVLNLMKKAIKYAHSDIKSDDAIRNLGEGWHGDEAMAIALYCVLKSPDDFENAIILSVNHDGDSDSTGAIVGNIMGAYLGEDAIPDKWKNSVELASELKLLAHDLYVNPSEIKNSKERYPSF